MHSLTCFSGIFNTLAALSIVALSGHINGIQGGLLNI